MQLGMIGAGRMGSNMSRRLARDGHDVVLTDVDTAALAAREQEGFVVHQDLAEFVGALERPRRVWIMIPAAFVQSTVESVLPLLDDGDVLIDGGNSWYRDDIDRADLAANSGVAFLD